MTKFGKGVPKLVQTTISLIIVSTIHHCPSNLLSNFGE